MIQSKTNTVKNVTMNTQGHVLSHITKTGSYPAQELLMRQVQFQVNMHVNTSCVQKANSQQCHRVTYLIINASNPETIKHGRSCQSRISIVPNLLSNSQVP